MEQSKSDIKLGRFLSLVLRHDPSAAGIKLDENGWADVEELLKGVKRSGPFKVWLWEGRFLPHSF